MDDPKLTDDADDVISKSISLLLPSAHPLSDGATDEEFVARRPGLREHLSEMHEKY